MPLLLRPPWPSRPVRWAWTPPPARCCTSPVSVFACAASTRNIAALGAHSRTRARARGNGNGNGSGNGNGNGNGRQRGWAEGQTSRPAPVPSCLRISSSSSPFFLSAAYTTDAARTADADADADARSTLHLARTQKRDALRALEQRAQQRWLHDRVFEVDAPPPPPPDLHDPHAAASDPARPNSVLVDQSNRQKWFGTAPYPYMNGSLHLGHAFSYSKVEFAAGFQRLLGKRVLFPFGFHATGMPIPAAADRLKRELLIQKRAEGAEKGEIVEEVGKVGGAEEGILSSDPTFGQSQSQTQAQAQTPVQTQAQILEAMGIPSSEIHRFADARHWLSYFPPRAQVDLQQLGCRIDWRRSFITTDANPYYDSFVRWQFRRLYARGRIQFGSRYTVWSARDQGPCLDHDRSVGEGVGVTEYTAIRLPLSEWNHSTAPAALRSLSPATPVVLVAATLRPETMYGQTNLFVGPDIEYSLWLVKGEGILCTEQAMRNLSFQGFTGLERGEMPPLLGKVRGADLVGATVTAPLSVHGEVYVLPMPSVRADMGTGIVTSVPGDAPADYAQLQHLRAKSHHYGIDPAWTTLDPVAVVETPSYGTRTAQTLVEQLKIHSPRDVHLLEQAKDLAYNEGYHKGTLAIGPFAGTPVPDARPLVKELLLRAGQAFPYADLEGKIISRSGDHCVAALVDQWFLDYGAKDWKAQTHTALEQLQTFGSETRAGFAHTIDWLKEWACARSYGLGTQLPWDTRYLIESLSDSTIYMAYYTVAHLLQGDTLDGRSSEAGAATQTPGPLGIQPENMTDEVWEYILAHGPYPSKAQLSSDTLQRLRAEFEFWYPVDLRSSGKDLIGNHMTFSLFAHAELFGAHHWPRGMRANGHLLLNGEKMSKSKGNALTLRQGVSKFGADAMRIALADAGDGIDDANFDEQQANANILRLHTLLDWVHTVRSNPQAVGIRADNSSLTHQAQEEADFWDRTFQAEMDLLTATARQAYSDCLYQQAIKAAWYGMLGARDAYRDAVTGTGAGADAPPGVNPALVETWIERLAVVASPVIPHVAEHLWSDILVRPTSIQQAHWPTTPLDQEDSIEMGNRQSFRTITKGQVAQFAGEQRAALSELHYVRSLTRQARLVLISPPKGKAAQFDSSKPSELVVFFADEVAAWQRSVVAVLRSHVNSDGMIDESSAKKDLGRKKLLKDKRVHVLVAHLQVQSIFPSPPSLLIGLLFVLALQGLSLTCASANVLSTMCFFFLRSRLKSPLKVPALWTR